MKNLITTIKSLFVQTDKKTVKVPFIMYNNKKMNCYNIDMNKNYLKKTY